MARYIMPSGVVVECPKETAERIAGVKPASARKAPAKKSDDASGSAKS